MRKIIGAMAVAGVLITGCTVESTPNRAVPSGSGDRATVNLAWSTLSNAERTGICDVFWETDDSDIIDYAMSPPDAMSRGQAEAFVDMLWERC